MGAKVKVGDVYTEIKLGENKKGKYGFATAKAEKGTDKITVFFSNPEDVSEDTFAVEVEEISEVYTTAKQVNGTWYKNYCITAKVSEVEGGATPTDLEGDLPF